MREINYSKAARNLIRFFCINGFLVEFLSILRLFLRTGFTLEIPGITDFHSFFGSDLHIAIVDFVCLIFFVIVFIKPNHIVFFAIISFLYSFEIILFDTLATNPIGQLLYLMGVSCLVFLGYYRYHRNMKIAISVLINYILIGHSIRFGTQVLIHSLISALGYTLVFLVTLFFSVSFFRFLYVTKNARIWDLSQYPELTQRDKEWLRDILAEKRYEEIAVASGVTVGTLKNRMHQIFNIVGMEDRIQLLATYSGYEVKF